MGGASDRSARAWRLAQRQHWVITRGQLLHLGFSPKAIEHRLRTGRLHVVWPGVYAVGRRDLDQFGVWMAAVLACGGGAALSHSSAAALWGFGPGRVDAIEVSVAAERRRRLSGIVLHRRAAVDAVVREGIPVTTPVDTLIDLAASAGHRTLERAVNDATALGLVDPDSLRKALDEAAPRPGVRVLRKLLDRRTFRFTRSGVERRFLRLARESGLPMPETNVFVRGFEVDFYWPELGLIVETDSLTYHRTPAQQAADRLRDQVHTAAGFTTLRFTEWQLKHEPAHVKTALAQTSARLAA